MRRALLLVLIGFAAAPASAATASYPPSCFADGLPLGQAARDPHAGSLPLALHGDFNACFISSAAPNYATAQQECHYSETVAISVFRVPCSGGKSATLLEIDRPAAMADNTDLYPTFPGVWVQQGTHVAYIRLAADANTAASQMFVNSPVYRNGIYTLENFASGTPFDYNQPFTLTIDNNTGRALQFDLGAYNAADYGTAAAAVPITGYLSGSWYDPAHAGEGIVTQIFDNADGSRTFAATWYTFDAQGAPYWLVAQAAFSPGATALGNVPVAYRSGGGFAGNFTPPLPLQNWGTLSVSFPDCNQMHFTYSGAASAGGPVGSGNKTYVRIGTIDNLGCQ